MIKFIYSEKATKFCKISTVDLSYIVPVKSTMEISQDFVGFSEYTNFFWTTYPLLFLYLLNAPLAEKRTKSGTEFYLYYSPPSKFLDIPPSLQLRSVEEPFLAQKNGGGVCNFQHVLLLAIHCFCLQF